MPPSYFMEEIRGHFASDPYLDKLIEELRRRGRVTVATPPPSVQVLLAGVVADRLQLPVVLVGADEAAANTAYQDALALYPDTEAVLFNPGSLASVEKIKRIKKQPAVIVTTAEELAAPAPEWSVEGGMVKLELGGFALDFLVQWLEQAGYERVDLVTEPGEYAVRGGIVDVYAENQELPLRVEFADDAIVSLRAFEPLSQRSRQTLKQAVLFTRQPPGFGMKPAVSLLPEEVVAIGSGNEAFGKWEIEFVESGAGEELGYQPAPNYLGNLKLLQEEIAQTDEEYFIVAVSEHHRRRLTTLLGDKPNYLVGGLSCGFVNTRRGWVVLTEREIYGAPVGRLVRRRFKGVPVDNLLTLRPGDYVVHIDYGVGIFTGTKRLVQGGVEKDYLVIEYEGKDRVYVPVENLGLIDRYIGAGDEAPKLDRLGGRSWLLAKAKAARASAAYAEELLETYARRATARTTPLLADSPWLAELEASFPYEETPDQLKALAEVREDLARTKPMDRLVCGDVGFGKTEIALRAAFQTVVNFKQVALLAPTTVLCYQHYQTFRRRLERFPVRVEMLSRFVAPAQQAAIRRGLKDGTVDIVIGTHLLLNPKVEFRDLGLLIIDEEQRFGVRQKERLRRLRSDVNVLVLSATPIPRTLYMALAGIRDISAIHTPPPGRKEVLTEVTEWDDGLIRSYVYRELNRGGQVFFVHNEIMSLGALEKRLRQILPDVEMVVAHGRLSSRQLAEIYLDFASGKYQMLLSTAIIESGLDLPNVNTIIVNRAERFGLADLHQLRGRVGRADIQAYALFLVSRRERVTADARKRLSALLAYSRLGAGYRLALRDMEIRGVGNLLGTEQHGHIARVGFNLYTRLLKEAIAKLRGEHEPVEPKLDLDRTVFIPPEYIPDPLGRIAIYKRLLGVEAEEELNELKAELIDRFGRYPPVVEELFTIARIRLLCRKRGVLEVKLKGEKATVITAERTVTVDGGEPGLLEFLSQPAV
ncbi:transcription-repair coupling factor [candidate division WOR-3 bacterium]|nr:transcription-repair coupling factor [candidate division WOR-3 bacterium]